MKYSILIFLLNILSLNLYAQYIPSKKSYMTQEEYNDKIEKLRRLYERIEYTTGKNLSNVYINKASHFAALGEAKDSVFAQIEIAFTYDSLTSCRLLSHFQKVGSYNFRDNCMKLDPTRWLNYLIICEDCINRNSTKPLTNKINQDIIKELQIISADDSRYRLDSLCENHNANEECRKKWQQQKILDSINLQKIQTIIKHYGYPGKTIAGEYSMIVFFVIQHADLKTREQYLSLIKDAVYKKELSSAALPLIMDRIHVDKYNMQIFGTQSFFNFKTNQNERIPMDNSPEAQKVRSEFDKFRQE